MNKLASRLWCLGIGFVLCLAPAFLFARMTQGEGEPISASAPPPSSPTEATVIEVRIARRGEIVNGEVAWPWRRWVVRFLETTITDGRLDQRELTFLVHSPIMELGVRDEPGQRGVLRRDPGRGYWFVPFQGTTRREAFASVKEPQMGASQ
jgi:hypothetical protein